MGNKSGYGSEPAYRGDVEFGYGDEYDDEEEDVKLLFWGGMEYGMNEDSLREAFRKYGDVVESKNTGRGGLGLLHSPLPRRPLVLSKTMESDEFKASSKLETVTFSEMKQEEIEALVEFMYCVVGSISLESLKKHVG
ncbi:putative BTB/POZ domain-containing protein At2g40450 [Brassica rapa]|uniref:putative BTB/POZ domain-containing protein At2g40450 n=1 Tax=Brassica campestris TaxID=3711 RepID=UPI0004F1830C|nr:putative BTB/POZ domain-containing protein At2g40450 [Brassica rapa]